MITNIATAAVYVEDQQRAVEFWTKQVGFVLHANHPMGPNANWIEVGPENAQTRLVLYPRAMMQNWQEMRPSIVFQCDDIRATYERMTANGIKFKDEPKEMAWGTFVIFTDPDGYDYVLRG